jgi:hypothetical protein
VQDDFTAADGRMRALIALDVAFDELDVLEHAVEVLSASGREVVQRPHVVAFGQQAVDQVRPDESATPCDQDLHGPPLSVKESSAAGTTCRFR